MLHSWGHVFGFRFRNLCQTSVHFKFPLNRRVPMIFYGIICAPGKPLCDDSPSVSKSKLLNGYFLWASIIALSYYYVHLYFLISGFKWLCHLSRHCLPILPGKFLAIKLQFLAPLWPTNFITMSSYSLDWINIQLPMDL